MSQIQFVLTFFIIIIFSSNASSKSLVNELRRLGSSKSLVTDLKRLASPFIPPALPGSKISEELLYREGKIVTTMYCLSSFFSLGFSIVFAKLAV